MRAAVVILPIASSMLPALANGAEPCVIEAGTGQGEMAERRDGTVHDAGAGSVIQRSWDERLYGGTSWFGKVEHTECESGLRTTAWWRLEEGDAEGGRFFSNFGGGEAFWDKLAEAEFKLTRNHFIELAATNNLLVEMDRVTTETCGCNAIFPELVGNKSSYEATQ